MGYSFYHPPENKVFVAQNVEFFKNSLITQEASGSIRAIRILIAITAFYDYEIWQMDVKTAFLNGLLSEEIYRDGSRRLIGLCQSAYIEKILKIFFMENSKRESIPMQEKLKLSKSQGASTPAKVKCMQNVPYASTVGSIMYTVRCTRPDVAFAQNITSQFQQNPEVYQSSASRTSSAEAEYIPASDASKEAMYCDNTRSITIANESGITKGARHYRAKVHYLCEVIEFGDVKREKVHTDDNLADPFTKALAFPKHSEHTKNIGMLPASSLM
ncbi:hypothetical protein Tco_0744482 [Tanacetum coccineum]